MIYSFGDSLEIPAGIKDIYIIGGGVSCDLFFNSKEGKNLSRETGIIITCNGSISHVKPQYQICGDPHAITYWSKHPSNDNQVVWIAKPKVNLYFELKINCIRHEDLFDGAYIGTGHEAFALAYYIQHFFDIENIYYIGFDFSDLILPRKSMAKNVETSFADFNKVVIPRIESMTAENKYCYAHHGDVMPYQKSLKASANWWKGKYELKYTDVKVYIAHLSAIAQLVMDDDFRAKLRCKSFLNLDHVNYRKQDYGYHDAINHGIHNS